MKTNIALIGFMATGKTTVGKQLAKVLEKKYVNTDNLIIEKAGKTIPRIFEEDGEIIFRELEIEVIKEVSKMRNSVIDCGGGVVLNKINVDRLKSSSILVLLTARPEVILNRVLNDDEQRPLLKTDKKLEKIRELLSFREPLYKRYADYTINTTNLSVDEVVEEIVRMWNSRVHRT